MDTTTWEDRRQRAVQRVLQGEAFTVVCLSEGVSRGGLHKWWVRHTRESATWFHGDSRRPHTQPGRTPAEIEEIVQLVRLELYNRAQFCGAQAIRWRLADLAVHLEWRYSGLAGKTPRQALAATEATLRFPPSVDPPREPLPKPTRGRYHVVRFIRSDGRMDVFGEQFPVPPEAMYAYVWGTIDVREQSLSLSLGPDSAGIPTAVTCNSLSRSCS